MGMGKSRTRTIIESLPKGLLVTNAKGQAVFMNPVFKKIFDIERTFDTPTVRFPPIFFVSRVNEYFLADIQRL